MLFACLQTATVDGVCGSELQFYMGLQSKIIGQARLLCTCTCQADLQWAWQNCYASFALQKHKVICCALFASFVAGIQDGGTQNKLVWADCIAVKAKAGQYLLHNCQNGMSGREVTC